GQAVGTLILLGLFFAGSFELWHFYAIVFLQSLFGVFQGPAFMASVTMLVPDEQRDRANAIMQMANPAAGIVAPVLAGLIFAAVGVTGAIAIDLITFLVAITVVLLVKIPRPRKTQEGAELSGSFVKELLSGLRYIWQRPGMVGMLLGAMGLNFVLNMSGVLMTPYLLERTGSEAAYGFILGVHNAGALLGAIIMGVWGGTRPRVYTIIPSLIVMGFAVIGLGMARTVPMLAIFAGIMLMPNTLANISLQSILQVKVPPDLQGRVFAAVGQMAMLITPLSYLIAGPLADDIVGPLVNTERWATVAPIVGSGAGAGIGLVFVGAGIMTIIIAILMFLAPTVRNLESDLPDFVPEPAPAEPEITPATV
ncbi:MAG: MFS transporter, partial [Chloroflexota bacterium]